MNTTTLSAKDVQAKILAVIKRSPARTYTHSGMEADLPKIASVREFRGHRRSWYAYGRHPRLHRSPLFGSGIRRNRRRGSRPAFKTRRNSSAAALAARGAHARVSDRNVW